ncbi:MAG TPA: nucleotidyltransferase family protein [Patescibacteria group bacterium]|nr:nucleotidyltransferase family protein [Patescibacteria group bacterium]
MKQNKVEEIQMKVVPILKKTGVTRAAIFGSVARGEQTEKSDLDILVDLPEGMSLFDVVDLEFKLEEAVSRKVDLVDYDAIKPRLKPYIMRDQIQIL